MPNNMIVLSSDTITTLKGFYEIDQSLRISHNATDTNNGIVTTILRSKSYNNTLAARALIPEIFPRDVNIYDLREFISVLSIINEPILDLSNDKYMIIKSADGKYKLRYIEANPDLVYSFIENEPKFDQEDALLSVTEAQFKSVLSAARTLRFEYVGFVSDGKKNVFITSFNKNNGDETETNTYSINIADVQLPKFKMFYKLDIQNIDVLSNEGDLTFAIDCTRKISKIQAASNKVFWASFDSNSECRVE